MRIEVWDSDGRIVTGGYYNFHTDVTGEWAAQFSASYFVGLGHNPCIDEVRVHMNHFLRLTTNDILPWAYSFVTYQYTDPFPC